MLALWIFKTIKRELALRITELSINRYSIASESPTLESISEQFRLWRVKTLAVSIDSRQITEIPLPALVFLPRNGGEFCVLRDATVNHVEYLSYEKGVVVKTLKEFLLEWSGIALLIEPSEKSGEPNYAANRRIEILEQIRKVSTYSLAALAFLFPCLAWPAFIFPFLFIAFGLSASAALFLQTLGQETTLSQAVCKSGTQTDCNKVVNSKLAKVYGDVSLAEIALLFFASVFGIQMVSLTSDQSYNFLIGWLSFAAVPVTLFSIYYQWRVLKTWCLLCLGVVACLWGLAGFYGYHIQDWSVGWPAVQTFAVGIAVPLLFWFVLLSSMQPVCPAWRKV